MYIPLYNKTTYTFLSSLIEVDDLINLALDNNLDSIAICDDNMFGVMEFIRKCEKNNLNPIVGIDLKDRLLFAKNYQGYQNLLKLITIKSKDNLTDLEYNMYKDNLICIPLSNINTSYETVFYPLDETNKDIDNVIYINKLLYKEENDYEYLKYLELLRDNLTVLNDYEVKEGCYYKEVDVLSKALLNTFNLAKLCNLKLPKYSLNLPKYKDNIDSYEYLTSLSLKGLKKRLNNKVNNVYLDRLKLELDVINSMGFANYFLVVYDYIKYAKEKKILVGPGRGSAAGSLVSYTLGITDIDPIKYNLLFERFLNKERITMPDIDTDFPDIYRNDVIKYVQDKYGIKNVCNIITFGTMGSKLCIRDIGRVMNIPLSIVDNLTKIIGSRKDSLKEIIETDLVIKNLINKDKRIEKLINISLKLEGIKRHTSVHAAGIIISGTPIDEIAPLIYDNNSYICGYEASYLEELGLLKMDFLGIKNLTTIMEICDNVLKFENIKIDFKDIELNDIETIKLFQNGDTNGIFQFESNGMKKFLKELKPSNFMDLSNAIALYRPGPASSIPLFIKRREGIEKVNYYNKDLENILKETYGIIIYQEQIMQIACCVANYSLKEADILRRAMAKKKKEVLLNEKKKFINNAINNGYNEDFANNIYELILKFASYGFNKSHSISYTIISYKMAYLKVHYKKYFYISLLNSVISDVNKTKEYMYEVKKYLINIEKPNVNKSDCFYKIDNNNILCPFNIIKGISKIVSSKIIEVRNNNFLDIYDFFSKTSSLTKNNYEILIKAGTMDSFGYNRNTLINNLDSLINYSLLCKDLSEEFVLKPEIIYYDEYSNIELINFEKELYGFYISNHPVLKYKLDYKDIIDLNNIESYFNKFVNLIVMVESKKEINTKNGDKMMFFTGSDIDCVLDFICFPKVYNNYQYLKKGDIIKVYGRVEKRNGNYQVIVSKIDSLKGDL